MSNKQAISGQVIEAVLAEETPQPVVIFIPITITTTLSVPSSYLSNVEANTETVRMYMENLAMEMAGDVVSVDLR